LSSARRSQQPGLGFDDIIPPPGDHTFDKPTGVIGMLQGNVIFGVKTSIPMELYLA
jgi:hypothetical protein